MSDRVTPVSLEGEIDVKIVENVTPYPIDSELSETSTNPVENRVIAKALNSIELNNPDSELSDESENCVQNKVVTQALQNKKDMQLDESIETSAILKLFS